MIINQRSKVRMKTIPEIAYESLISLCMRYRYPVIWRRIRGKKMEVTAKKLWSKVLIEMSRGSGILKFLPGWCPKNHPYL